VEFVKVIVNMLFVPARKLGNWKALPTLTAFTARLAVTVLLLVGPGI
jgi:hypothetical protein